MHSRNTGLSSNSQQQRQGNRMQLKILYFLSLLALSACVYVPKPVHYYDEECGIGSKKLVLSEEQLNRFVSGRKHCADEECIHFALSHAVGTALIGPISAIISGTIVVTGNTIFWIEKKANCRTMN